MSKPSPRLRIRSVVDQVYEALLERIVSGELGPGTQLRQEALADSLGVSRTPLREALMRLATEGFIRFNPNRGAAVARRDLSDMIHAWQARLALEPTAARLAAERRDPAAIDKMRGVIERQRSASEDVGEGFALNRQFHMALIEGSGNPHLTQFGDMVWKVQIGMPIFAAQVHVGDSPPAWISDHEAIVDALVAGDADAAERLARQHIEAHPPRDSKEHSARRCRE